MDGLFIMEKPKNKMDDLGGTPPYFRKHSNQPTIIITQYKDPY